MKKIELTNFQNGEKGEINQFQIEANREVEEICRAIGARSENDFLAVFKGLENFEEITNHKIQLFTKVLNKWWEHMNYKQCYWEKRNSTFFFDSSSQKTLSRPEKVKERLEILLFNQELFSTTKEIENNDLAKVIAEIYQKRKVDIENFVWETKKRMELEEVEDMLVLKKEIIELSKKLRNYENVILANSSLKSEKEELTNQLNKKKKDYNELIAKNHTQESEITELKKSLSKQDKARTEQENKFASMEEELRKKENLISQLAKEKQEIQSKSWYQLNTTSGKSFWGTNLVWIIVVSIWVFSVQKREKRTKEKT